MESAGQRIVHCLRAPVGGAFRHVADLVRAQKAMGHKVGLICAADTGNALAEARLQALAADLDLGLVRMPMRRSVSPSDMLSIWRVLRALRAMAPDVLHGHGAKGGAYARLLGAVLRGTGRGVRRFYSPHGGSLHYSPDSLAGKVFFRLERLMERMTEGLVFVSHYEAEQYAAKVQPPRCEARVIHNGLRPEEFYSVRASEDAVDFLFIGEMRDLKGPDVLLRALAEIRERSGTAPSARFVGPGDAAPFEELASMLWLDDRVSFHSAMPAREAFTSARCVVIPSRAESMPYIVLEAVAAAVPMITTRVGGIPEIFAGREDRLVTPGDEHALADALQAQLRDPAMARLEAVCHRDTLRHRFSLEGMAGAICEFYQGRATEAVPNSEPAAVLQPAPEPVLPPRAARAGGR